MLGQILTGIFTGLLYSLLGKAKNAAKPDAVDGVKVDEEKKGKFHWGKALENAVYGAAAGAVS